MTSITQSREVTAPQEVESVFITDDLPTVMRQGAKFMGLGECTVREPIGNESVPIQLAQCRFPGLVISSAKILIYFNIKYPEAIVSDKQHRKTVMV